MAAIYYVHWNEAEARQHADQLAAAGHTVRCHASEGAKFTLEPLPDAFVVSLERLPSHGRAVAEWFREAKKRRSIPLVFVGGEAEKAKVMRARFPDAVYCGRGELERVLAALPCAARQDHPVAGQAD